MIDLSVCQNSERFAFDIRCLRGRVDRNVRLSICQHCSFHARLQDEDDKEDDKEGDKDDDEEDDEEGEKKVTKMMTKKMTKKVKKR